MQNILILSAGRRVELVLAFRDAIAYHLPGAKVFCIDLKPEFSAACQFADNSAVSPRADDPGYEGFLIEFCHRHSIGVVIPTIDTELEVLAQLSPKLATLGTAAIISDEKIVHLCRDKRKTGQLFAQIGIRYPEIYLPEALVYPCFVKPVSGSSSIDAQTVLTETAAALEMARNPSYMFMEYIGSDYAEYTVDIFFDRQSQFRCAVPRQRIEVRAGEVSKAITSKNQLFDRLSSVLNRFEGFRGCITMQVFYNEANHDVVGLEINPRFGGGYPLSHAAGADYPSWIIREYLLGESIPTFDNWKDKLMMLRYDAKIVTQYG